MNPLAAAKKDLDRILGGRPRLSLPEVIEFQRRHPELKKKTWNIKFTGTFKRVGYTREEAEEEAKDFLKQLILLHSSNITDIREV